MSAAAVTRSVGTLEAHLNMRLLNRTTRSLSLTDVGREYLHGCRAIIEKLDEMESNLLETTRDPQGTLRIATPMTFATSGLGALLASYRALHPRVDFDVTTFDTHIDLVEGGFDVCFSDDRRLANSSLVSRTLTSVDEITVASPAYLARHGAPRDPAALNRHGLLTVSDGSSRAWEFADADGVYRVNTGSALTATSSAMVRVAALNHMGIALLPQADHCRRSRSRRARARARTVRDQRRSAPDFDSVLRPQLSVDARTRFHRLRGQPVSRAGPARCAARGRLKRTRASCPGY